MDPATGTVHVLSHDAVGAGYETDLTVGGYSPAYSLTVKRSRRRKQSFVSYALALLKIFEKTKNPRKKDVFSPNEERRRNDQFGRR